MDDHWQDIFQINFSAIGRTGYDRLETYLCVFLYFNSAGILEQSVGARNEVGIGLSYWPASVGILEQFITNIANNALLYFKVQNQKIVLKRRLLGLF